MCLVTIKSLDIIFIKGEKKIMMNPSELLTSLKMDLGIYAIAIPIEDVNTSMMEVIKLRSLRTFSQYYPYVFRQDIDLTKWTRIKDHYNESIYEIPEMMGGLRIMEIRKVDQQNKLIGGGTYSPLMDPSMDMYNDLALSNAGAHLMSSAAPPFTFRYEQPNLLYLYNSSTMSSQLTVEFAYEHAENLSTIKYTAWDSFYELALLDIKSFLYNSMKHYQDLQTAYGTISLKIDDWASAAQERKDLLSQWNENVHIDSEQIYII